METSENSLTTPPLSNALGALRTAVASRDLRTLYREKPITMHKTYPAKQPMQWPRVIRQAYAAVWSGKHSRVIIKAPRGGGKSKLLGTLGFDLWYLRRRSVVNMGGSMVQAEVVYNYFADYCDIDASITNSVAGGEKGITMTETEGVDGNKFSCVTASPKQVRGKHPDVLISDETCETADEVVHAALPMVNDSEDPLVIMASTFHKIYGIFQETWDNADERGYLRIQWDIFDVVKTFDPAIWEEPEVKRIAGIDRLKKYAAGRTGDPDGWIQISNVIQAWREKPTEDWFEVEYMGSRPSAAGLVLKPEDIDNAVFDSDTDARYNYVAGATCILGIDWGFSSMTAVVEGMGHRDSVVAMLDNRNYHQTPSEEIIKDVVEKVRAHGIRFIYADSAGKFENNALQNALAREKLPCTVIEVVFSKEKPGMVGNLRAHFERAKIKIPKKLKEAFWQFKRYRYQEGTDKPVKKDDHVPDATMCMLQHFVLGNQHYRMPAAEAAPGTSSKPITAGLRKKTF